MADAAPESDYKVPEKVDPNALLKDAEAGGDAALAEYTKKLMGETYSPADDDRRVVILELRVICQNRPGGDIVYTLDDAASIKAMKKNPFQLKEDCKYKIQVTFRVQHEIVSGLKYHNAVKKKIMTVATDTQMLGSYRAQKDPHKVTFPRNGWEEAPSGTMARGSYTAKSKFFDDDKNKYLEYEYGFKIAKDW